jgi:hypothetical protein
MLGHQRVWQIPVHLVNEAEADSLRALPADYHEIRFVTGSQRGLSKPRQRTRRRPTGR